MNTSYYKCTSILVKYQNHAAIICPLSDAIGEQYIMFDVEFM